MFFRREKLSVPTVTERIDALRRAGFTVEPASGAVRVTRGDCAVELEERDGALVGTAAAGIAMGKEIGSLVDGGYQKFFRAPSGIQRPALATALKALHDFEEDLTEALGQQSYYNQSLGTVSTFYRYDRVKGRDAGVPKRIWES